MPAQYPTIQAAIDAAQPGDTVRIAAGNYTENVIARPSVSIVGAGKGATTIQGSATTGPVLLVRGAGKMSVSQLQLVMEGSRNISKGSMFHSVILVANSELLLEDCKAQSGANAGVLVRNLGNLTARRCVFSNNNGMGVGLDEKQVSCLLEDCDLSGNKGSGLNAAMDSSVILRRCKAEENGDNGFLADGESVHFTAEECTASRNAGRGFDIELSKQYSISKCVATTNERSGFYLCFAGEASALTDSRAEDNEWSGIYAVASMAQIENNRSLNNKRSGLLVGYAECAPKVVGNHFEGNGGAGILVLQGAAPALSRNTCAQNHTAGICVDGWNTAPEIMENECRANGASGIVIQNFGTATIAGNICADNVGFGLLLPDGTSNPVIETNTFSANQQGDSGKEGARIRDVYFLPDEIEFCLASDNYARLESLRKYLIEHDPHDDTGRTHLEAFYGAASGGGFHWTLSYAEALDAKLAAWQKAFPDSSAPLVARARLQSNIAWQARGTGWASEVTDQGREVYTTKSAEAWKTLAQAEKVDAKDPALHSHKMNICKDLGIDAADRKDIFEIAVQIAPAYAPIYTARLLELLPRWGGSKREMEDFLAEIPKRAGTPDAGLEIYAVCLDSLMRYETVTEFFGGGYKIDYTLAKPSFELFLKRYPEAYAARDSFALAACLEKDAATAKSMFDLIGTKTSTRTWGDAQNYRNFREWAMGTAPYPASLVTDDGDVRPASVKIVKPADALRAFIGTRVPPILIFGGIGVFLVTTALALVILVRVIRQG